jgi:hypothetical protein
VETQRLIREFMADQIRYQVDTFIVKDKFRNQERTTDFAIKSLQELIRRNIFNVDVMLVIQGRTPTDYIRHFDEMLILTINSQQCTNCLNNKTCQVIFRQSKEANTTIHDALFEETKEKKYWSFRFAIGGLIGRESSEQKEILEKILQYNQTTLTDLMAYIVKVNTAVDLDLNIFPKRERSILLGIQKETTNALIETKEYPRIQFHIFGVGASEKIIATLMENQEFIVSFDSNTPSFIAAMNEFFDKDLKRVKAGNRFSEEDRVSNLAALNTLKGYYNTVMLLYLMESLMNLKVENPIMSKVKTFIKYPSPKASKMISQKQLDDFYKESKVGYITQSIANQSFREPNYNAFTVQEDIEAALKRWTQHYAKTTQMVHSLAILNGLVIFKTLTINQIKLYFPTIKGPTAAMNVITTGYKDVTRYPLCEDTPEYKTGKTIKTIQIREKYHDLVLRYLLKDASLIPRYYTEF